VNDWLLENVKLRTSSNIRWCNKWFQHNEAVARLTSLWVAWEEADRKQGESPSHWWVHHFDNQWAKIIDSNGVFRSCTPTEHKPDPKTLKES